MKMTKCQFHDALLVSSRGDCVPCASRNPPPATDTAEGRFQRQFREEDSSTTFLCHSGFAGTHRLVQQDFAGRHHRDELGAGIDEREAHHPLFGLLVVDSPQPRRRSQGQSLRVVAATSAVLPADARRPPYRSRQDGGSPYGRDKRGRSRVRRVRRLRPSRGGSAEGTVGTLGTMETGDEGDGGTMSDKVSPK